jgi:hypothetical protein
MRADSLASSSRPKNCKKQDKNKNKKAEDEDDSISPIYLRNIKRLNQKRPLEYLRDYFGKDMFPDSIFDPTRMDHSEILFKEGIDDNVLEREDTDDSDSDPEEGPTPTTATRHVWSPVVLKDKLPGHSYYYTCLNRMDYVKKVLSRWKSDLPSTVVQALLELQDQYQLLTIHMELKNSYANRELDEGPVHVFRPSEEMAFSEEQLPDLFVQIFYCEFWGDRIDSPYLNDPVSSNLIGILNKALPSPCKGRSVTNKIPDSWIDKNGDKTVFNAIIRIIFAGLLGIYQHCEERADFITRRKMYFSFCLNMPEGEEMNRWIGENKHLIVYILREFVFYSVESIPSLCDYMEDNYYWSQMRKNTFHAMDTVRRHINERARSDGDATGWFTGLQALMDSFNKNNLGFCHRPISSSFLDMMVKIIKDLDDFYYGNVKMEEAQKSIDPSVMKELRDNVDRFELHKPLSYEWLGIFFGVDLRNMAKLQESQLLYTNETSRSMVSNVMKSIAEEHPRDYLIIREFFIYRKTKFLLMFYPLPDYITRQQIESYHIAYQTLKGQPLDENAGIYYVCPNCGELKAKVMPKDVMVYPGSHTKERERTLSNEKTSIDMTTGVVYCSKPPSKTTPKKRTVATDMICEMIGSPKDAKKETKKLSKDNRKKKMRQNCPQTELIRFRFIGKILRTDRYGLVIVCPFCLCLTTFGRFSYENSDGDLSCGCRRVRQTIDYPCCICKKQCDSMKQLKFYLVYDDEREEPCTTYAGICRDHGQTKWINQWKTILCLSTIRLAFQNQWSSHQIGNGEDRVFVDNKNKRQKGFVIG